MNSLEQYISEKLHLKKGVERGSNVDEFIEFAKTILNKWKMTYTITNGKDCIYVTFNRKLSDNKCANLCAEFNSTLNWSRYKDAYVARWGNDPEHKKFVLTIYEKSK